MNGGWPAAVQSVQPGGGPGLWLARTCGRLRRAFLRRCRPAYVKAMAATRVGECPDCRHDVVDGRDLLWVQNVCGHRLSAALTVSPFRDRFGLVRLGRPELALALAVGGATALLAALVAAPLALLGLLPPAFALWFFRDPERPPPPGNNVLLSPADGVLDDVRHEASCPFFPGKALRLGIYLSVFDVHVQRAPVAGRVLACDYRRGLRRPTAWRGHTDANEQLVTTFVTAHGTPVAVRQIAGPFASRVCSVLRVGDELCPGQRFGLIKFGSRCEIWVPDAALGALAVARGSRVRAGITVLAPLLAPAVFAPPVTSSRAAPSGGSRGTAT